MDMIKCLKTDSKRLLRFNIPGSKNMQKQMDLVIRKRGYVRNRNPITWWNDLEPGTT